jgi:hypothetical protein
MSIHKQFKMKKLIVMYCLAVVAIACDSPEVMKEAVTEKTSGLLPSASVFEGTWKWLETTYVDANGNLHKTDSLTSGYSVAYKFYETDGLKGKLQVSGGPHADLLYTYEYADSDNPQQKKLSLDKMANSLPEVYYWEIRYVKVNEAYEGHLYLKNVAYFTSECCDEKVEQHFVFKGNITL